MCVCVCGTYCVFLLSKQKPFPYKSQNQNRSNNAPINPKESNLVNDVEVLLDCKV